MRKNMNNVLFVALTVGLVGIFAVAVIGSNNDSKGEASAQNNSSATSDTSTNAQSVKADKIEVVHFHATQQCFSCIKVGEYALKTIVDKFPEEYQEGKIVFRDINGELRENLDIVAKYQARGSSLFVNAINEGKDNISEDATVWRYVYNETQFMKYFEDKLSSMLGS